MEDRTLRLVVEGKVQGVFYRASAKEKAEAMRVRGSVKNTREGNVEIICQGSETQLQDFINWCKQGPPGARVENIRITEVTSEHFEKFSIVR